MGPLSVPLLTPSFYPTATVALDFTTGRYRVGTGSLYTPTFDRLSGLTVTRASVGYAERNDGTLVQFGTNTARITDKGLLVEESRTNLLLRSQEFDHAAWSKTTVTVTTGRSAPDGTNTAATLTATAASSGVFQTIASTTGISSVYIRRRTGSGTIQLRHLNAGGATTIAVTSQWQRFTSPSGTGTFGCIIDILTSGDEIDVWGAQTEGSGATFPTSYIPTTSASATRAADVVSIGGLGTALTQPYTVSARLGFPATDTVTMGAMAVSDGTTAERFAVARNGSAAVQVSPRSGSVNQTATSFASKTGARTVNLAFRATSSAYASAADGSAATENAITSPTGLNLLTVGNNTAGSWLNDYVKRILIYPRAFTDAELQAVTA